jgi:hypothetical protein
MLLFEDLKLTRKEEETKSTQRESYIYLYKPGAWQELEWCKG